MKLENNATEEETYYNSESEGKEFDKDFWEEYNSQSEETLINTCEETFGKECYNQEFWEDCNKNTAEEKNDQKKT
jgi:hypothetical protein